MKTKASYLFVLLLINFSFYAENLRSQCAGVSVSTPNDITICNPDDVNLNGIINGNYLGFEWTSNNGYSNTTDISPTVNVNQTTTYELTALVLPNGAPNLITNGDFEGGNTGFTTQYNYVANQGPMALWNEGRYTVGRNPKNYHQNFKPCNDHTSGTGRMMILNGSNSLSIIWCQTINVNPNTYYVFDAWASSVENTSPAELQFSINGNLIGNILNLSTNTCVWENFNALWYSGSSTSVNICITNQNTEPSGNDFALDDISFSEACQVTDNFTVTLADFTPEITGDQILNCLTQNTTLIGNTFPANNYTYTWSTLNGTFSQGSDDNEIVVSEGGLYNLIATDVNNCTRSISYDVYQNNIKPASIFEVSDTLDCFTKQVSILGFPSHPNITFAWQGPNGFISGLQNPIVTDAGLYQVVITDIDNYCTETYEIEVFKNTNLPSFDILKNGELTCSNKSITLAANNSVSNLNYKWSGPGIQNNLSNGISVKIDKPGKYELLGTNENGCSETKKIDVSIIPPIINSIKSSQPIINCKADSFKINTLISGNWDSILWLGPANFTSNKLEPYIQINGDYFLTALDSNGCIIKDTISILKNIDIPIPNYQITPIDCASQKGSIFLIGQDSLVQASIINLNEELNYNQSNFITNAGNYQIEVLARNGCKDTFNINLTKDENFPKNTINYNDLNCTEKLSKITTISNQDSVVYEWYDKSGLLANSPALNVSNSGPYYLVSRSNKGCISYDTITIKTDTISPEFKFEIASLSCKNNSVIPNLLSEKGNSSYEWKGPNGFTSNIKFPSIRNEGKYEVKAISSNGCNTIKTFEVKNDLRLPLVEVKGPDELNCKILTIEKYFTSSTGMEEIKWVGQNLQNISTPKVNINKPGKYFLMGSHPESGCKDTLSFDIKQNLTKPVFSLAGGDTINCVIKNVEKIVTTQNASILWKKGNQIINNLDEKLKINSQGDYKILLTNLSSFCADSLNFKIYVDTIKPNFDLIAESINCKNKNAKISLNTNRPYEISFSDNSITQMNNSTYLTSKAGEKVIFAKDKNGCITSKTFNIKVDTLKPVFSHIVGDLDCKEKPVLLIIKSTFPDGISIKKGDLFLTKNDSISITEPSILTITVKDDKNGCESERNVEIRKIDNGPAGLQYELPFNCKTYSKQFSFTKVSKVYSKYKLFVDGLVIDEKDLIDVSPGKHNLKLIDEQGCSTELDFEVPALIKPTINPIADLSIDFGETVQLKVNTNLSDLEIKDIRWIPETGLSCTDCLDPICSTKENINYAIRIIDERNCEIEAEIRIDVKYKAEVFFPNVIKYNNPTNNLFYPIGTETISIANYLSIFDRWGNQVFVKKDFMINDPENGWDGNINGIKLSNGVYTYVVQLTTNKGEILNFKGDVTLID